MRKAVVAAGWYADSHGHNNKDVSKEVQKAGFLRDMWIPHIKTQLKESLGGIIIYQSDCEIKPWVPPEKDLTVIKSLRPPTQHHHNDSGAAQLSGAMYAYCNEMDFIYLEQDCFVVGLLGAHKWAKQTKVNIAFGTANFSQDLSRGEHCFIFVPYEYLKTYISKLMNIKWHVWSSGREYPELEMVNMFTLEGARWPFGYGRLRPIKWSESMYYVHQPTEDELNHLKEQLFGKI